LVVNLVPARSTIRRDTEFKRDSWSSTLSHTWDCSAQPFEVVYTASDGESFSATIQNNTFSTLLPNIMDYQVKVFWQYADGTTDYYFVTNQTLSEGIGVVGLDLVIS